MAATTTVMKRLRFPLMRGMEDRDTTMMRGSSEQFRLETPSMSGYKPGMSSSCVLARKMCSVFTIPQSIPCEMADLLAALDIKLKPR
jgi:hypothetical protein